MQYDFDSYLLYEITPRTGFTCRIRVILKDEVQPDILKSAAIKAFKRFPYYSKTVSVNDQGAYILEPCDKPITVAPEDRTVVLGSSETNGLMFAITYHGRDIYFNFAHNFCGGCGAMFWIKTTLWQYLTDLGFSISEDGVLVPGTPVTPEEIALPDMDSLPDEDPLIVSQAGDSFFPVSDYIEMMKNPGSMGRFYYPVSIKKKELMKYARANDGSPNSILSAMLFKVAARVFPDAEQLSGKIICNYREDVGCPETYRDLVRFLRAIYKSEMKDWPLDKISTVTRGSMYLKMEPEYSWEQYRKLYTERQEIDKQPDLASKKKYAVEHSLIQGAVKDTFTISYVGRIDWGGLGDYLDGIYSITDGHLMLEVNATADSFCISFQTVRKDGKYLKEFLKVLDEAGIHYEAGGIEPKNLPALELS